MTAKTTSDVFPKLVGADVEVGNFVLGAQGRRETGALASRAVLAEIEGHGEASQSNTRCNCPSCAGRREPQAGQGREPGWSGSGPGASYYNTSQDWGRKFLPANGGCAYIDLGHLELCIPEVISAYDHVSAWHAMLRIARDALDRANAKMPRGENLQILVNNSDGQDNSYGGHMNFLVSRQCYENIFHRKMHHLLFLASHFVSSIVFTGTGKVGAENGQPEVDFQLTQRGDYYETLTAAQTTYNRPIVNSRDETLCARFSTGPTSDEPHDRMARLHVIFFDSTLCQVASLLKIGVTQIVLAMIEQECVPANLILDDPLDALTAWGHDPDLRTAAKLVSGDACTAVEMQEAICDEAKQFVDAGRADGLVPRAAEIMELWEDTLAKLARRDWAGLAGRLDWVLKRLTIERAMGQRGFDWTSPEAKHLDHVYSSLDPLEGLYWTYEQSGPVEKLVTDAEIERFVHTPPEDTRAWLRAQVLRHADPANLDRVDWNLIALKFRKPNKTWWPSYTCRNIEMVDPFKGTRKECESLFGEANAVEEVLMGLSTENASTQDMGGTGTTQYQTVTYAPALIKDEAYESVEIRDISKIGLKPVDELEFEPEGEHDHEIP